MHLVIIVFIIENKSPFCSNALIIVQVWDKIYDGFQAKTWTRVPTYCIYIFWKKVTENKNTDGLF